MVNRCKFIVAGNTGILYDCYGTLQFTIAEKVPSNYSVWNIGKNMGSDEYIPMCVPKYTGDQDILEIDTNRLYAIRLPVKDVALLRRAASMGVSNLTEARKASQQLGYK